MANALNVEEMKAIFDRVTAYRVMCEAVRSRSNSTLFNGFFFLGLTFLFYTIAGVHTILFVYLAIALGEIGVGIWKKVRPAPESFLADALLQFAFAATIAVRQVLIIQAGGRPNTISVLLAAWVAFDAFRTLQTYFQLRAMFRERPTPDQLAYVDDLVAEIRESDPETDPFTLDLPTEPYLKAKLLGKLAIFVEMREGLANAATEEDVFLEREEGRGDDPATGYLSIEAQDFPGFDLSTATWRNYVRWKTECGSPPPPTEVRPIARRIADD